MSSIQNIPIYLRIAIFCCRLAGYVEAIAIKLGFDVPPMSTRQAAMWKTKYTAYFVSRSVSYICMHICYVLSRAVACYHVLRFTVCNIVYA